MDISPYNDGLFPVTNGHQIYFAQYGNPDGIAVLILHGGPGSQSHTKNVKDFDLSKYRFITFDQRGCGQSLPLGEIKNNDTPSLIVDIESLREFLKIKHWVVSGSSWGATLALTYAQAHPQSVLGLMLGSIFLARKIDIDWSFSENNGVAKFFPDLWEKRLKFLDLFKTNPHSAAFDLLRLMEVANPEVIASITSGVMDWEGNLMNAQADLQFISPKKVTEADIASVKIFLHYEANQFFLSENQILNQIKNLQNIPSIIIHGRYDLLCPPDQAWDLAKKLPKASLRYLPTSNHKLTAEGEICKKIAFNQFLDKLSFIISQR